jgi:hypothetical protein
VGVAKIKAIKLITTGKPCFLRRGPRVTNGVLEMFQEIE